MRTVRPTFQTLANKRRPQMPSFSKQQQILGLVGWLAVSYAASAVGARGFHTGQGFLRPTCPASLGAARSHFWPRCGRFCYTLMGIAAWLVWRSGGFRANRQALTLFLLQLAFNALWSWLFFAFAPRRLSARRHRRAVASDRGHPRLFLARAPACRRAARPLLAVGGFRVCTQFFTLETQPTDSGLVRFLDHARIQTWCCFASLGTAPPSSQVALGTKIAWEASLPLPGSQDLCLAWRSHPIPTGHVSKHHFDGLLLLPSATKYCVLEEHAPRPIDDRPPHSLIVKRLTPVQNSLFYFRTPCLFCVLDKRTSDFSLRSK